MNSVTVRDDNRRPEYGFPAPDIEDDDYEGLADESDEGSDDEYHPRRGGGGQRKDRGE